MLRGGGKAQLRTLKRLLASAAFVAADLRAELCCLTDFGATMPPSRAAIDHTTPAPRSASAGGRREKDAWVEAAPSPRRPRSAAATAAGVGAGAAAGVEEPPGEREGFVSGGSERKPSTPQHGATASWRARRGSPV